MFRKCIGRNGNGYIGFFKVNVVITSNPCENTQIINILQIRVRKVLKSCSAIIPESYLSTITFITFLKYLFIIVKE